MHVLPVSRRTRPEEKHGVWLIHTNLEKRSVLKSLKDRKQTSSAKWRSASLEKQMGYSVLNCFINPFKPVRPVTPAITRWKTKFHRGHHHDYESIQEKSNHLQTQPTVQSTEDTWYMRGASTTATDKTPLLPKSCAGGLPPPKQAASPLLTAYDTGNVDSDLATTFGKDCVAMNWLDVLLPITAFEGGSAGKIWPHAHGLDRTRLSQAEDEIVTAYVLNVAETDQLHKLNGFGVVAQAGADPELEAEHSAKNPIGFFLPYQWITQGYLGNLVCEVQYSGWNKSPYQGTSKSLSFEFEKGYGLFNPDLEAHSMAWKTWIAQPANASHFNFWDKQFDKHGQSMTDRMKQKRNVPYHEQFYRDYKFGAIIDHIEAGALPQIFLTLDLSVRMTQWLHNGHLLPVAAPASANAHAPRAVIDLG